jgi:hypothetical protein
MRRLYILVPLHRSVRRVARIRKDGRCRKPARHRKKVTLVVQLVEPIERNQPFRERTLLHLLTAAFGTQEKVLVWPATCRESGAFRT